MIKRGEYFVLEGGEYSGKTTYATKLVTHLRSIGRQVIGVREPGTTPTAEAIRRVLLEDKSVELLPATEAMLFYAARTQLMAEVVRPVLRKGIDVVSDRNHFSSLAYQVRDDNPSAITASEAEVLGRIAMREIYMLGKIAIIDISLKEMQERIARGQSDLDKIESKPSEFHKVVLENYRKLPTQFSQAVLIDGLQEPDAVLRDILKAFKL